MYTVAQMFLILIGGGIWLVIKELVEIYRMGNRQLTTIAVIITIFFIVVITVYLICAP